jgi:hypothetical protein
MIAIEGLYEPEWVDWFRMGGQACVLYGAAEFSRDLDLALLPDPVVGWQAFRVEHPLFT